MQTLLVGDIHGCFDELGDLIDRAGLCAGDRVISVGDFVDRGPKPTEVVRFFKEPGGEAGVLQVGAILGNHERKHLRGARGEVKLALSQEIAREQMGIVYPDALVFFDTLPYFLELPEAIIVHGGLDPDPSIPLHEQLPDVLTGTQRGEALVEAKYGRPWYEVYNRPKPVVFGHVDFLQNGEPFIHRNLAFGLDTGCAYGRRLTGLLLPSFTLVSVRSRANHWLEVRRKHLPPRPPRPLPPPVPLWDEPSERSLAALISWACHEHQRFVARLRVEVDYDRLSARDKGLAYEALVASAPAVSLLHLARQGRLTNDSAKRALKSARHTRELALCLGLTTG